MKSPPKISVVIPSYNKVEYIQETLDSIVSQSYPNLEVIIQDGGSIDGTIEIIKKYAKKYPEIIQWESKKDRGQTDAINKGLKKATGEILTFINADDVYEKRALKTVGEYFVRNPDTTWLAGRGRVINSKGEEVAKFATWYKDFLLSINHYSLLITVNYLIQPSVFLNRKTYEKYGPFVGGEYVMEYDLWLKMGRMQMPKVLNQFLSKFRLSGDNISSTLFREVLEKDFKITKKYTKNPLILLLHKIHNLLRIIVIKTS